MVDIKKALTTRTNTFIPCRYCKALEGETAFEILARVSECNNCLLDIRSKGEWSGSGMQALRLAYEKSPNHPSWPEILKAFGLISGQVPPTQVVGL